MCVAMAFVVISFHWLWFWIHLGESITSEATMHFPSVSEFSLFPKIVQLRGKYYQFDLFSTKFFGFHPQKFLMTFFSHCLNIFNFAPHFRKIVNLPHYFGELILISTSDFVKFTCFLHTLRVFRFPIVWTWCIYASHNARRPTGHVF